MFGDSDRLPTMEDVNEMKYLDCCVKEVLRMYPSAPMIARCLTKDTVFSKIQIQNLDLLYNVSKNNDLQMRQ